MRGACSVGQEPYYARTYERTDCLCAWPQVPQRLCRLGPQERVRSSLKNLHQVRLGFWITITAQGLGRNAGGLRVLGVQKDHQKFGDPWILVKRKRFDDHLYDRDIRIFESAEQRYERAFRQMGLDRFDRSDADIRCRILKKSQHPVYGFCAVEKTEEMDGPDPVGFLTRCGCFEDALQPLHALNPVKGSGCSLPNPFFRVLEGPGQCLFAMR